MWQSQNSNPEKVGSTGITWDRARVSSRVAPSQIIPIFSMLFEAVKISKNTTQRRQFLRFKDTSIGLLSSVIFLVSSFSNFSRLEDYTFRVEFKSIQPYISSSGARHFEMFYHIEPSQNDKYLKISSKQSVDFFVFRKSQLYAINCVKHIRSECMNACVVTRLGVAKYLGQG